MCAPSTWCYYTWQQFLPKQYTRIIECNGFEWVADRKVNRYFHVESDDNDLHIVFALSNFT